MKGLLIVKLIEARDLAAKDSNGLSDPYFQFSIQNQTAYSSVQYETLNPTYNETFNFFLTTPTSPSNSPRDSAAASSSTPKRKSSSFLGTLSNSPSSSSISDPSILEIIGWDKDLVRDDLLGGRKVDLHNTRCNEPIFMWVKLVGEKTGEVAIQILRINLDYYDSSDRDPWGFKINPQIPPIKKDDVIKNSTLKMSKVQEIFNTDPTKLAKKGINIHYKAEMWRRHSKAKEKAKKSNETYADILDEVDASSPLIWEEQIDKDIMRTFIGHPYFNNTNAPGSVALRKMLLAFSVYNTDIGYCQVMNYVGAFLLLLMEEEDAFWALAALAEDVIVDYYSKDMSGLQVDIKVLEHYVKELLPDVSKHLEEIQAFLTVVCMQWFLCLFIEIFPNPTTMRLWDILMCTGRNILIQTVLYILKIHKAKILSTKTGGDFYDFLKSVPQTVTDYKTFFKNVLRDFPISVDQIAGLRQKYKTEVEETLCKRETLKIQRNTLFTIAEITDLRKEFLQYTTNNTLTRENFDKILQKMMGDRRLPFAKELFEEFDKSHDGLVDFREFSIGLSLLTRGSSEEKLRLCFTLFDLNKDGFIQQEELTQIMGSQFKILFASENVDEARKFVKFAFANFDKNKDGQLSFEEFKDAIMMHPVIVQFFHLNDLESQGKVDGPHSNNNSGRLM